MTYLPQLKIPATYMRGGTSKGVFFKLTDLPLPCQVAGPQRDALLLRVIGSPDPYAKQTDGMGGATSSTSKTVILSKSSQVNHDVDYLFGQVAIDKPFVDWSGNCGNLTAAVGAFAISSGLISADKLVTDGIAVVRIWQKNIGKTIVAHVPMCNGEVQETGDFMLDGVTFPAAEVPIEFLNPADGEGALFPTGKVIEKLKVPVELIPTGELTATMISAGIPTVFLNAEELGLCGNELQEQVNNDEALLEKLEAIRAYAALKMGLIDKLAQAKERQHTPKLAFVAPASDYESASGVLIKQSQIDLQVRAMSMGKLHHAMMGTAAVAIASAASVLGTVVNIAASHTHKDTDIEHNSSSASKTINFGHPSGTLKVSATASCAAKVNEQAKLQWQIDKVMMSRSARVLMEGWVRVPDIF
ncbi:2-methylaconitate cis-trans isomerase PrpF [Colwellia sp. D2M02]|uniref:2-methylaconitate cis-trans isomerase PrpF n=1 Tax=Colwellia sp. D2M02 TaxID=2841562 RepID=UPI001C0A0104|nr:2-methylaconitate cis-trans isomerase PrpF [Colwellia sp. D2M02]MBU2894111.1 2-methylaconitate cis-trans isomerase PrpF [Colwellia sp. D2M02]